MLGHRENGLPEANKLPQGEVEVVAYPDHDGDGQDQMGPKPLHLFSHGDIRPREGIQARDVRYVAQAVEWKENRQDDYGHRYEKAKQELQVLQEEVAIEASDADELSVADGEDILDRLDGSGRGCYTFSLGYEGGFVVTRLLSKSVGYHVEAQALTRSC